MNDIQDAPEHLNRTKLSFPVKIYNRKKYRNVLLGVKQYDDKILSVKSVETSTRLADEFDTIDHSEDIPDWNSEAFQEALTKLSDDEREILVAYYRQGHTQTEIANDIQRTQSGISRRLSSSYARLRYWLRMPPIPPQSVWKERFPKYDGWLYAVEYAKDCCQISTAERMTKILGRRIYQCNVHNHLHNMLRTITFLSYFDTTDVNTQQMRDWLEYAITGKYMTWRTILSVDKIRAIRQKYEITIASKKEKTDVKTELLV